MSVDFEVVMLSTYLRGGAGRAAVALCEALAAHGVPVDLRTRQSRSGQRRLKAELAITSLLLNDWQDRYAFSPALFGEGSLQVGPKDVVHLHWGGQGLLDRRLYQRIVRSNPMVWTLHDAWPFTGGCHLPGDCSEIESGCAHCPMLRSPAHALGRAARRWKTAPPHIRYVAPSRWMKDQAIRAGIRPDRIAVIPNAVRAPTALPTRQDVQSRRASMGIETTQSLVGFVASDIDDPNKRFTDASTAIDLLGAGVALRTVGRTARDGRMHLGEVEDLQQLSRVVATFDVLVVTSVIENLPNVIVEAMALGVPVVAYDVGGIGDAIKDRVTGRLVAAGDVTALSRVVQEVLDDPESASQLAESARDWVHSACNPEAVARDHLTVYEDAFASFEEVSRFSHT